MDKREARRWFRERRREERREFRHVTREGEKGDTYRRFPLFGGYYKNDDGTIQDFGVYVHEGGWCGRRWQTTNELWKAVGRWVKASYAVAPSETIEYGGAYQCGGCRYFAAFDSDYGLCCNAKSPQDGKVCFEHGGCYQHSNIELGIVPEPSSER